MPENATTPHELPSPPRKASWKRWTLAFSCVLAIALAVLLLKAPAPERVSVRYAGSTNYNGLKTLVFKGTNALSTKIVYYASVTVRPGYPFQTDGLVYGGLYRAGGDVGAGETFTFYLDAAPKDIDWYVTWDFYEQGHVTTHWEKARKWSYLFVTKHKMRTLARWIGPPSRPHIIPATDLHD